MALPLSLTALARLGETAAVPAYDPRSLRAGIVHFGVGNFHRAHQATYLDDLFNLGLDHDWALIGAGVRESDKEMRARLQRQDWLTTVVEQETAETTARITGPMVDFLKPGDSGATIARLADPAIRIVSLTVTEGGYFIDPATQRFDPAHPDILDDAAHADAPRTVFGLMLAALRRRRASRVAPFAVMSCDNIPGNGRVTRQAVVDLARLNDAEMADWVAGNVAFPNGMVDRITPGTTDRERSIVASDYGIEDQWPVFCERFRQWVLEDKFPAGRPALEKVGVQFVADVEPYERMKIRILNGGHATIAYAAALLDVQFVHEAMANELVRAFLAKVERQEILPAVPPVPGTDLGEYYKLIEGRFSNPKIGDTIARLCFDGSNRQPKFILPSVADRLKSGLSVTGLALVSALWARYCSGTTDSGKRVAPNDPNWARLTAKADVARTNPQAWLEMRDIYGPLGDDPAYRQAFSSALNSLWKLGTRPTLSRYLEGTL